MFPRRALDMVILSILNESEEGLTGYSIVKEMKKRFGPMRVPSPGTIYPRLSKLNRKGYITESGKHYVISEQGKERLRKGIPDILEKSMNFYPMLHNVLMRPLPFKSRMHYISHGAPSLGRAPFEELVNIVDHTESIPELETIKESLLRAKERIQERLTARLKMIDEKIQIVDKKLKQCEEEKADRIKIPVEDGDQAAK